MDRKTGVVSANAVLESVNGAPSHSKLLSSLSDNQHTPPSQGGEPAQEKAHQLLIPTLPVRSKIEKRGVPRDSIAHTSAALAQSVYGLHSARRSGKKQALSAAKRSMQQARHVVQGSGGRWK